MDTAKLKLPEALRPYADQIVGFTDAVCQEHLDQEYANLCREAVAALGRKRPSPLQRGDLRIWAAGVLYAIGQANFLFDPSQSPHASADQLSEWLGVKKTSMANKSRMVRDALDISPLGGKFIRRDVVELNPLTWLLEVNGFLVDIRHAPAELQVDALQLGLISYLPGQPPSPPEEIDRLSRVITTDCYNLAEQVTAFCEVFAAEVTLPAAATVVGSLVEVTGFDLPGDGDEVTAHCRHGATVQDVRVSDLVFPPDTPGGWINAAYRHCIGRTPHPAAMPAGWQPAWL